VKGIKPGFDAPKRSGCIASVLVSHNRHQYLVNSCLHAVTGAMKKMSTLTELAQHIAKLYPLKDKCAGKRYRVVGELAGMTELEEINGEPRYIQTLSLQDKQRWDMVV